LRSHPFGAWRWLAVLHVAVLPALAACSDSVQWQEEVQLADGRVIVVNQKRKCDGGNHAAATHATCVATDAWLSFELSETNNQEVTWHEHLNPMVLNVHGGRPYVVGYPIHPKEFRAYGAKNPPYIGYVWQSARWQRIPFDQIPPDIYEGNLLIESIPKTRTTRLSLTEKSAQGENGDPGYPMHLRRIEPKFKKPLL
jgi:hypothetical protein